MGIFSAFTKQLTPIIDRRRLYGEINNVREILNETLGPSIQLFIEAHQEVGGFKSQESIQYINRLTSSVRLIGTRWPELFNGVLDLVRSQLDEIEKLVPRKFAPNLSTADMSYSQANILLYLNTISRFADDFLRTASVLTSWEAAKQGGIPFRPSRGVKAMNDNALVRTRNAIVLFYTHRADLTRVISSLTDATISEDTEETVTTSTPVGRLTIMDRQANISAYEFNPFYVIGKWVAEYQVKRFKRRKEERTALQLRLQELRIIRDDRPLDQRSKVQRLIENVDGRIADYDAEIARFEDRYLQDVDEWSE